MAIADQFAPNLTDGSANAAPVPYQVIPGDGAITIAHGTVVLTKATAAAITIDVPPVAMNGAQLVIISTTAVAHVITQGAVGFNAKGSSGTATFTTAIGNGAVLVAYNGNWYVPAKTNVTLA
jgi:hypothetical protein